MRTYGIWVFGLLASAIVGVLAGYYSENGLWGGLAAMVTFGCARLLAWAKERDSRASK